MEQRLQNSDSKIDNPNCPCYDEDSYKNISKI